MKKLFVFIFLLAYFTVNTGFVVSLHYCMNKIASVEFGSKEKKNCDKCGMSSGKKGCCHNEVKVVKLNQDQVQSYYLGFYNDHLPIDLPPSVYLVAPFQKQFAYHAHRAHAPPLINKQKSYLKNCVFRI